jgi:FKBP-type peptidyl-prolyl cis-trans isomerase (trigger factor)
LQVQVEPATDTSIKVTVNVPAQRCDEAYNTVMAELRKDYNVPGFRNNEKVPVDMLIQAAGGERQVKFACLEQVMHMTITEVRTTSLHVSVAAVGPAAVAMLSLDVSCWLKCAVQAFQQCPKDVIEGSVKVESDAEALVDQFQRNADLQYVVTAEVGDLGVSFSASYTGMQLQVEEVLNPAREDLKVHQAVTRYVFVPLRNARFYQA